MGRAFHPAGLWDLLNRLQGLKWTGRRFRHAKMQMKVCVSSGMTVGAACRNYCMHLFPSLPT